MVPLQESRREANGGKDWNKEEEFWMKRNKIEFCLFVLQRFAKHLYAILKLKLKFLTILMRWHELSIWCFEICMSWWELWTKLAFNKQVSLFLVKNFTKHCDSHSLRNFWNVENSVENLFFKLKVLVNPIQIRSN